MLRATPLGLLSGRDVRRGFSVGWPLDQAMISSMSHEGIGSDCDQLFGKAFYKIVSFAFGWRQWLLQSRYRNVTHIVHSVSLVKVGFRTMSVTL